MRVKYRCTIRTSYTMALVSSIPFASKYGLLFTDLSTGIAVSKMANVLNRKDRKVGVVNA